MLTSIVNNYSSIFWLQDNEIEESKPLRVSCDFFSTSTTTLDAIVCVAEFYGARGRLSVPKNVAKAYHLRYNDVRELTSLHRPESIAHVRRMITSDFHAINSLFKLNLFPHIDCILNQLRQINFSKL